MPVCWWAFPRDCSLYLKYYLHTDDTHHSLPTQVLLTWQSPVLLAVISPQTILTTTTALSAVLKHFMLIPLQYFKVSVSHNPKWLNSEYETARGRNHIIDRILTSSVKTRRRNKTDYKTCHMMDEGWISHLYNKANTLGHIIFHWKCEMKTVVWFSWVHIIAMAD